MSRIPRKTAAWASGAVLAVGGCAAGIVLAVQGGGQAAGHTPGGATAAAAPQAPLRLVSISPADGSGDADGAAAITVAYNQPLPASAAWPAVTPAIAGFWRRVGDTAVFTPAVGFPQHTKVTVTVPGLAGSGPAGSGNEAAGAAALAAGAAGKAAGVGSKALSAGGAKAGSASGTASPRVSGPASSAAPSSSAAASSSSAAASSSAAGASATFTTAKYSTLRLQQILAQLGYLPLTWTAASAGVTAGSAAAQLSAAYAPPAGSFQWQGGYPAQLRSLWSQGATNTLDMGALYGFQADHKLTIDGKLTTATWTALLTAAAANQRDTHGYSYAIASKSLPERLTIWHDGKKVFSSLANTGIGVAPTADGTYPVYEKLPFQVMSGTNPDGSHYADPVEWVSYFNGGDAVHYFARGSYGWPQSLGCVELPYSAAKDAYPYLPYGTLVTVS